MVCPIAPSLSPWCNRAARLRDGDHEAQVEQQLERRRGAMRLVGVAGDHGQVPATVIRFGHPAIVGYGPLMLRQQDLITRVRELCAADPRLDAALMYGSIAQGVGDEYSDIEFWLFFTDVPELKRPIPTSGAGRSGRRSPSPSTNSARTSCSSKG